MSPRILTVCGIASLLASASSTILILLLAIALLNLRSPIWPLAIVAAILNIFVLAWVAYMLASSLSAEQYSRKKSLGTFRLIASILLGTLAALITLGSLVWIQLRNTSATGTFLGNSLFTLQEVEYGVLGAAVVFQAVFTGLWTRSHNMVRLSSGPEEQLATLAPQPEMRAPQIVQPFAPPMQIQPMPESIPRRASIASASTRSSYNASLKAPSSKRSSFQDVVRPMTSRSRLIRPHSWTPSTSTGPDRPSSSKRAGHASMSAATLTTWARRDSTATQSTVRSRSNSEASAYSSRDRPRTPVRTRLETIPGSRANSPARALDGPFPVQYQAGSTPLGLPNFKSAGSVKPGPYVSHESGSRPPMERFITAPMSPQVTPTEEKDESHIHPLFRSASPLPPPTTTAGTVITGAQMGGQYMTPKTLSRATSKRRGRGSLYDPNRARSHSQLRQRARQQQQQLPIPHTIVRARSLETLDSWQTRLDEGEDQQTRQQRILDGLLKPATTRQQNNDENDVPISPRIPESLQVKVPQGSRLSSAATIEKTSSNGAHTPRRALSETSGNTPRSSPRKSPRKSRDVQRSSMGMKQRRSASAAPEIMIYVDGTET